MPAAESDASTAATCSEWRNLASVNKPTRRKPCSRAPPPASARHPAPKVKVGMPTVKAWSLSSVSVKSAWQQGMLKPPAGKSYTAACRARATPARAGVWRGSGGALAQDQVGGLLRDHDDRQVGVAGGKRGHHAAIDHPQRFEAVFVQRCVDHRERIPAHPAGAALVEDRGSVGARELEQILVALRRRSRPKFALDVGRE